MSNMRSIMDTLNNSEKTITEDTSGDARRKAVDRMMSPIKTFNSLRKSSKKENPKDEEKSTEEVKESEMDILTKTFKDQMRSITEGVLDSDSPHDKPTSDDEYTCPECGTFNKKGTDCYSCANIDEDVAIDNHKGRPRGAPHIENVRFWDLTDEQLEYIIKDAGEAMEANPDNPKNSMGPGNYADQQNDAKTVLHHRYNVSESLNEINNSDTEDKFNRSFNKLGGRPEWEGLRDKARAEGNMELVARIEKAINSSDFNKKKTSESVNFMPGIGQEVEFYFGKGYWEKGTIIDASDDGYDVKTSSGKVYTLNPNHEIRPLEHVEEGYGRPPREGFGSCPHCGDIEEFDGEYCNHCDRFVDENVEESIKNTGKKVAGAFKKMWNSSPEEREEEERVRDATNQEIARHRNHKAGISKIRRITPAEIMGECNTDLEEGYPDNFNAQAADASQSYAGADEVANALDYAEDYGNQYLDQNAEAELEDLNDPQLDSEDYAGILADLISNVSGTMDWHLENDKMDVVPEAQLDELAKKLIDARLTKNESVEESTSHPVDGVTRNIKEKGMFSYTIEYVSPNTGKTVYQFIRGHSPEEAEASAEVAAEQKDGKVVLDSIKNWKNFADGDRVWAEPSGKDAPVEEGKKTNAVKGAVKGGMMGAKLTKTPVGAAAGAAIGGAVGYVTGKDDEEDESLLGADDSTNAKGLTEGTWSSPRTTEKAQELVDMFVEPIPAGSATDVLYDLVGDDELFDAIDELAEIEGPDADARLLVAQHVYNWAHSNMEDWFTPWDEEAIAILSQHMGDFIEDGPITEKVNRLTQLAGIRK